MTSLFGVKETPVHVLPEKKDPTWFKESSKRVIPNHLVPKKKLGFQLTSLASKKDAESGSNATGSGSGSGFNSSDFNLISFGDKAHRNSAASFADTLALYLTGDHNDTTTNLDNDDLPLYNNNEDAPPARSLYDLNDEVILSLNRPTQNTDSLINKDPKSFANVFSKREEMPNSTDEDKNKLLVNPLQDSESAILVFGYPEVMANQVIAFFLEFGTVMEDFQASKPFKNSTATVMESMTTTGAFPTTPGRSILRPSPPTPIFSGQSWVKITYDNPSSAMDALQESGSVFNGVLIGVVPYTKDAVEKLQKRKLTLVEDIGGGLQSVSRSESSKVDKGVVGDSNDMLASYIKRLDVKDGSELFLKVKANGTDASKGNKKSTEKLGVWGSISNYLFGFHDL